MASKSTWLELDPWYKLIVTNQQANWHTQMSHDSFKIKHQRPKSGQWPNHWKSQLLPENGQTVSGVCFSLNISSSYLSLCLSLNSLCNETSRCKLHLVLKPGLRSYLEDRGFWLGSSSSHMGSSPKQGLAGFQSQPCGFESQTRFWLDLRSGTCVQVPTSGKWFHKQLS